MQPTRLMLPLALVVLGLVAAAPAALAAPATALAPAPTVLLPGGVHLGIGVGIRVPIRAPRHRTVVVAPSGHYETRIERVWVPGGALLGYDVYGNPVLTRGYWTERRIQVWVPYRVIRRQVVRPAPRVGVGVGFGFGF